MIHRPEKKNLDCVQYLMKHSAALSSSNASMFVSTVNRLLDPVYNLIASCKSSAIEMNSDLMPGSLNTTGRGISQGTASASRDLSHEDPIDVQCFDSNECNDDHNDVCKRKPGDGYDNPLTLVSPKKKAMTCQVQAIAITPSPVCMNKTSRTDIDTGFAGKNVSLLTPVLSKELQQSLTAAMKECTTTSFGEQSLVSFIEPELSSDSKDTHPQPEKVTGYLSVHRNPRHQIYMQQDLSHVGHCTIPQTYDDTFISYRYNSSDVRYTIISNSQNYVSKDRKLVVINSDQDLPSAINFAAPCCTTPISTCTDLLTKAFEFGLGECFTYDNKKRSNAKDKVSASPGTPKATDKRNNRHRKRKNQSQANYSACCKTQPRKLDIDKNALPVITMGWSTLDANQYKFNRTTIAGTIKPFLRHGNLPKNARLKVIDLVETVLKVLPGEWAFNIDKESDPIVRNERKRMMADFKEFLGGDRNIADFRIEGLTILIPASVGYHKDTLNCNSEGMKSVVSINANIPMNEKTIPSGRDSSLWKWLNANSYYESFPCSIILYSRKCCYTVARKMSQANLFASKDLLRKCVHWGLTERVGSVVDYNGRVWQNDEYPSLFTKNAIKNQHQRFKSLYWSTTAAYDKMVSYPCYDLKLSINELFCH